ncbi:MAG: hypothetical protein IKB49_04295 [Alphaproteobacteria bacterium]|nr:hypothetical protein [Alphaproteobacteria bacterium]
MAYPSKEIIFNSLCESRHRVYEEQTLFNPIQNDAEYWYYSDLYNLFRCPTFDIEQPHDHVYRKFDSTPAKNITPYEFLKQHTTFTSRKYTIYSPHPPFSKITKTGNDIKLSRYTCFCMFRDIPQLIFTRTYFLMPNAKFKDIYDTSYSFARIYQRERLRASERQLAGLLKRLDANIALFHHESHKTFFGGTETDYIRNTYQMPANRALADNMGAISMHARRHAIDSALTKFRFAHTQDFHSFSLIFQNELLTARRKMHADYHITPEQDFYKKPINVIETEYKKLVRDFTRQYAPVNINNR